MNSLNAFMLPIYFLYEHWQVFTTTASTKHFILSILQDSHMEW